ncbi:hypothetical protein IFM89_022183 [Coptis chinensis]|uniref:DUF4094 domain-containing protein n=1 Tax=Coptis chinensis TaxID=261450 RepID=A0A835GXE1_9MAGN|nr:hypothetical protein IFM89_022183 [Coptis chinensis]
MSFKSRGGVVELPYRSVVSKKWSFLLCIGCFCAGMLFTSRMWTVPETKDLTRTTGSEDDKLRLVLDGCDPRIVSTLSIKCSLFSVKPYSKRERFFLLVIFNILFYSHQKDVKRESKDVLGEVSKTHDAIQTLDKTISNLEMELAAARATQESILNGAPLSENLKVESTKKRKYLMVVGINTAFSSRKRRDSVRATWLPQGEKRKKLEEEKGIIARFVIGHSATSGGILDRAIEAEDRKHGDFLRLDHVEGYLELSAKTKIYFATAVALWDADFYVKVDDDVHVNIATLGTTLARHRSKPRVYIGCMKSGPVLAQKGVRYHEPEYWKFGEEGNKYFRHATGQLYAISRDLASYVSINRHVLHKYANEDVSLGAWFIGLDVVHIDDRRLCCGTPPGNVICLLPQIASGKPRQEMSVLLHLIGAVVEFASHPRGSRRSIDDVEKVRMLSGVQPFKQQWQGQQHHFPTQEGQAGEREREKREDDLRVFSFMYVEEIDPYSRERKQEITTHSFSAWRANLLVSCYGYSPLVLFHNSNDLPMKVVALDCHFPST